MKTKMEMVMFIFMFMVGTVGLCRAANGTATLGGTWSLFINNSGVSAMHMAVTSKNTVVLFDRTDYGPSQIRLPEGTCREDANDLALTTDCYAHSVELDLATGWIRPLEVLTDTWCSSGAFQHDGTLVSTGGYNDGARSVRFFTPCEPGIDRLGCDWKEKTDATGKLSNSRWYASNHILPDGTQVVVGGRRSFTYEFIPDTYGRGAIPFPFLRETFLPRVEDNLYPFLHLAPPDGHLFVFAGDQSLLLNYKVNNVVRRYPNLPGGGARNYPSSGSSVLLPLHFNTNFNNAEVLICGGAPYGSFLRANNHTMKVFDMALASCGRMVITDVTPSWAMESMPVARVMGDMLILPNGEILIINGAQAGTAGWYNARQPALSPLLYRPDDPVGSRFTQLASSSIPRMYHSTAGVLPNGRILVGGSNPNIGYDVIGVDFPTEFRLEIYSPYYLDSSYDPQRPFISYLSSSQISYGSTFTLQFIVSTPIGNVEFRLYAPPFTTHSYSMNQRQLVLGYSNLINTNFTNYTANVHAPPSSIVAPAGYYMLFVVNSNIPSSLSTWVQVA